MSSKLTFLCNSPASERIINVIKTCTYVTFMFEAKVGDYIFNMIDRIERRASAISLTKEQMLKSYFYLNACRKKNVPFELEFCLERFISEMTADELAVIAMGYFKTQTKIKLVSITDAMCKRVIEERETVHEVTLAAILKVL